MEQNINLSKMLFYYNNSMRFYAKFERLQFFIFLTSDYNYQVIKYHGPATKGKPTIPHNNDRPPIAGRSGNISYFFFFSTAKRINTTRRRSVGRSIEPS